MGKYVTINSTSELKSVLADNKYVLIDFWATWCPPCKAIAPKFEELAASESKEGQFVFAKVDVDAQPDIAQEYGIRAMPTFVLIKDGEVLESIRGANLSAIQLLVSTTSQDIAKSAEKPAEKKDEATA